MKELNKQEVLTQLDEFKKKNRQKYHILQEEYLIRLYYLLIQL